MSRRRVSKAEGAALAALFTLTFAALAALAVALFKASVVIFRWLATTADDLRSGVPERVVRARARFATLATAAYVLVAYGAVAAHVERSPWHIERASWEMLGALLAVAVAGASFLTWRALTGIGRRVPAWVPLAASGVAVVAGVVFAEVDGPSRAEAEALVHRGNLNEARTAVFNLELSGQTPAAAALADEVHEREVNEAPDLAARLMALRGSWHRSATEARVRGATEALVAQEARGLLARNDAAALDRLTSISNELPGVNERVRASARLAHAAAKPDAPSDCPAEDYAALSRSFSVAEIEPRRSLSRARAEALFRRLDGEARASEDGAAAVDSIQAWSRTEGAARCVQALGGADVLTPLDLPARLLRLQRVADREHAREEREAERRQRREEREAERERRRQERDASDNGGSACGSRVSCCDGSCSPSCRVDRGSFRGCCSHHGGICG